MPRRKDDLGKLLDAARRARRNAYAPYSRFRVGAAVLMSSGRIYAGCNVENASYGLTCCAERAALFNAVCAGERRLMAVAVVLDPAGTPCGACRQVLHEFGPDARIVLGTPRGAGQVFRVKDLLPLAFEPHGLKK